MLSKRNLTEDQILVMFFEQIQVRFYTVQQLGELTVRLNNILLLLWNCWKLYGLCEEDVLRRSERRIVEK